VPYQVSHFDGGPAGTSTSNHTRLVAAAGGGLMGQQAPQRVQSRVERRAGRSLDPFAVPAAVGHPVFDEPRGEPLDIGAEPGAIRERPRIDGAIDLAAPIGQVIVLPTAGRGEARGGIRQSKALCSQVRPCRQVNDSRIAMRGC